MIDLSRSGRITCKPVMLESGGRCVAALNGRLSGSSSSLSSAGKLAAKTGATESPRRGQGLGGKTKNSKTTKSCSNLSSSSSSSPAGSVSGSARPSDGGAGTSNLLHCLWTL